MIYTINMASIYLMSGVEKHLTHMKMLENYEQIQIVFFIKLTILKQHNLHHSLVQHKQVLIVADGLGG